MFLPSRDLCFPCSLFSYTFAVVYLLLCLGVNRMAFSRTCSAEIHLCIVGQGYHNSKTKMLTQFNYTFFLALALNPAVQLHSRPCRPACTYRINIYIFPLAGLHLNTVVSSLQYPLSKTWSTHILILDVVISRSFIVSIFLV